MALQPPQTGEAHKDRSEVIGKYTQMALDNSHVSQNSDEKRSNRSFTSKSPQRVGKFSQMAINQKASASNKSVTSKSPARVGKFTQMAMMDKSQQEERSVSPVTISK